MDFDIHTYAGVLKHYEACWGDEYQKVNWERGPYYELGAGFTTLCYPPRPDRKMWTYATVGMSVVPEAGSERGIELHLFTPDERPSHVELLYAIAHYHLTGQQLGVGHTVNFGRPWYPHSRCSYGLVSLPYLDGPTLEWSGEPGASTRFLWLIPITPEEREFKVRKGLECLEQQFEEKGFNYLEPTRQSVV